MRRDRRELLISAFYGAIIGAIGPWRRSTAASSDPAANPEIADLHRETRNRLLGPVGARGRAIEGWRGDHKPYPDRARWVLPREAKASPMPLAEVIRGWEPRELSAESIPLPLLSQLLRSTNGLTGSRNPGSANAQLRAAPSAGALYSGEVYAVTHRVDGLPRGAWYYDVERHTLVEVRRGPLLARVAEALEQPAAVENAAAVVFLSNVFARYRHRYANRGYRYALIDSGHIGENLRLAAAAAGLSTVEVLDFHDDHLNELLGLDGTAEAVCAVHALGRAGGEVPGWPRVRSLSEKRDEGEHSDVVDRWHEATKLVPGSGPGAPMRVGSSERERQGPAIGLPSVERAPSMSVQQSIRTRRSARQFTRQPMALAALTFVLEMAHGRRVLARVPGVDLHLVIHRVAGISPGHYLYVPSSRSLDLLREGDLEGAMVRACLRQKKAGDAAVGCVMVARLGPNAVLARTRRYRDLLVEAGSIGERIYLAAESAGVAARNLAAYRDDAFNDLLGLDGREEAAIHLTMLGPGD
ncbi:MAG: SagB family peptide dehydrogenase [Deltaproteobacteria bacterium]|nr:SagB family peptide dehydrogenase [Deltaproteobacteria bacterium]